MDADFRGSEGYRFLAGAELGVVGLLVFGVVGLLDTGLLDTEPERKSGKRCGEMLRLSKSFLGMVDVKENVADRCGGGRGEGDGERPFLVEFTKDVGVSLAEDTGVSRADDGASLIVARTAFLN